MLNLLKGSLNHFAEALFFHRFDYNDLTFT